MRKIFCTLSLLIISLTLIGQQSNTYRINFQRQSRCYPDVVWYGTNDGLYEAYHCAGLANPNKVQSRNNEIVISNVVDLYEECGSLYNTVLMAIYDGQRYQAFTIDTGHILCIGQPRPITRLAWDKLKKDGLK